MNTAPANDAALILPFTTAPFHERNTVKSKNPTPRLQKESQKIPNSASSEDVIPTNIKIIAVISRPIKKYFRLV